MDLVTETVGEFPELQGQVGRQLSALTKGNHESVAAAIEDHYRPLGPNDRVPTDPVAVTLALADKLDTLAAFWAIDETPTGSSDPYALRRAALGVVRIVVENSISGDVVVLAFASVVKVHEERTTRNVEHTRRMVAEGLAALGLEHWDTGIARALMQRRIDKSKEVQLKEFLELAKKFLRMTEFVHERVEPSLRDRGFSVAAVRAGSVAWDAFDDDFRPEGATGAGRFLPDSHFARIVGRVEALDAFLKTEDGANLLAGYKRAVNILAAEEKKGKGLAEADLAKGLDANLLAEPAEKALYDALEKALPAVRAAVEKEEFAAAMKALADLRAPVDAFFDKVMVNADDAALRRNRLLLLSRLREALSAVADFSKIEG
jgi:glycyl-tRNA synthetase beta chain